jgi:hypothetical protein
MTRCSCAVVSLLCTRGLRLESRAFSHAAHAARSHALAIFRA